MPSIHLYSHNSLCITQTQSIHTHIICHEYQESSIYQSAGTGNIDRVKVV